MIPIEGAGWRDAELAPRGVRLVCAGRGPIRILTRRDVAVWIDDANREATTPLWWLAGLLPPRGPNTKRGTTSRTGLTQPGNLR